MRLLPERGGKALFPNGEWRLLLALFLEIGFFAVVAPRFFSGGNLFEVLRFSVELGLLAVAMTPIIITGGIDLSVGSTVGLAAVVFGQVWGHGRVPVWVAAGAALGVGACAGC